MFFITEISTNIFGPTPKINFYLKNFLYLPLKNNFSSKNIFHACLKGKITWHAHLAHLEEINFCHKNFLYLPLEKQFFKQKKISRPLERTDFLTKEKVSYNYLKIQFSKQKKFLYLPEKLISCTCTNENGSAIFYFSKLIRVQTENVIQSLFVKGLYFSTFYYTFLYSTSLCFSSCGRFLYHQRPLCPSNSYLDRFLKR